MEKNAFKTESHRRRRGSCWISGNNENSRTRDTCAVGFFLPVKRSHSVLRQGGINGAVNIKGEGDSPEIHFYDTVKGGDFLGHQPCIRICATTLPLSFIVGSNGGSIQ